MVSESSLCTLKFDLVGTLCADYYFFHSINCDSFGLTTVNI